MLQADQAWLEQVPGPGRWAVAIEGQIADGISITQFHWMAQSQHGSRQCPGEQVAVQLLWLGGGASEGAEMKGWTSAQIN